MSWYTVIGNHITRVLHFTRSLQTTHLFKACAGKEVAATMRQWRASSAPLSGSWFIYATTRIDGRRTKISFNGLRLDTTGTCVIRFLDAKAQSNSSKKITSSMVENEPPNRKNWSCGWGQIIKGIHLTQEAWSCVKPLPPLPTMTICFN